MAKKILVPCVHSNGTSKESLLDAIEEAYSKLGDAYEALRETCPNGRDYWHCVSFSFEPVLEDDYPVHLGYLYKDNPYERARNEWLDRLKRIDSVREELSAIAGGIHSLEMEVEVNDDAQ